MHNITQENKDAMEDVFIYDERHKLWGYVTQETSAGWTLLRDKNRGFSLPVPFARDQFYHNEALIKSNKKPVLFYVVRNYYKPDNDGMLRLVDARLCGFCGRDMKYMEVSQ